MGRKAKSPVKQKKTAATQSNKKSSSTSVKKIKNYDRCKDWLIEQKNTPHDQVPISTINDDVNSEFDNELDRKIEPEEKSNVIIEN